MYIAACRDEGLSGLGSRVPGSLTCTMFLKEVTVELVASVLLSILCRFNKTEFTQESFQTITQL